MAFNLPSSEQRANFRHLYLDTAWFGVLAGSTAAFLAVYITHLGASSFQVSLLTAGPAVVSLILSLPSGRWLERRPLVRATYLSALLHRAGYLGLIPLTWLYGAELQIWAVVAITMIMSIPGTILAIGFNALFADAVPPEWRGEVVGRRNAIMAITMTTSALLSGLLLDRIVFPINYQVVFAIGALGAALSSWHIGRLRISFTPQVPRLGRPLLDSARPGMGRFGDVIRTAIGLRFLTRAGEKPLLRLDLLGSSFGPFMFAYLLFYIFQYLPLPLFPLLYVRVLNLSHSAISLGNALFFMVMLFVSLRTSWITSRLGNRRMLVIGAVTYSLYPLMIGLAKDANLFWMASLLGGGVWAVLNPGLVNRLMERVPDDDRPAYMALHNLVLNLGILAGSLASPLLDGWIGLRAALLLGAALRLLAGVSLYFGDKEQKAGHTTLATQQDPDFVSK